MRHRNAPTRIHQLALCAATLVAALSIAAPSRAQTPALTVTSAPVSAGGPVMLGWTFTVNAPVTVTSLGFYDYLNDGFSQSHPVGLWDSMGNLLSSATLTAGTSAPLINQYRYAAISPLVLLVGSYVVAGQAESEFWLYGDVGTTGLATDSSLTLTGSRYVYAGGLVFPQQSVGYSFYGGANFLIEGAAPPPSDVPEPGVVPFAIAASALLGGLILRRRRRA